LWLLFEELLLVGSDNSDFFLTIDRLSSVSDGSFLTEEFICCVIPFDSRVGFRWWRFRCDCIGVSFLFTLDAPGSSSDDDKQIEGVDEADRRREGSEDGRIACLCSYSSLWQESVGRRRFWRRVLWLVPV
jgi:hypothetical protein